MVYVYNVGGRGKGSGLSFNYLRSVYTVKMTIATERMKIKAMSKKILRLYDKFKNSIK